MKIMVLTFKNVLDTELLTNLFYIISSYMIITYAAPWKPVDKLM